MKENGIMYETIGERIRHARELREFDQRKLSAKVDVAVRTLQRWEKGVQTPDSQSLLRLAKSTSVRPEWLLTGEGEIYPVMPANSKIIPLYKQQSFAKVSLVDIPLLASVPAGRTSPAFYVEHAERFVTVDDIRDPGAFALVVRGKSMSPKIEDGDLVVVSPQAEVKSGDICVVRVNNEDVLKKVKIDEMYLHLIPLNPTFEPVTVRKRDIMFIWKVVKVIKNL
jgi:repressor LexA